MNARLLFSLLQINVASQLATACNSREQEGSQLQSGPIACAEGAAVSFSIHGIPDLSHKTIQVSGSPTNYELKPPGQGFNARFDTCVNGEEVQIKQILFQANPMTIRNVFIKDASVTAVQQTVNPDAREIVYRIPLHAWEESGFADAVNESKFKDVKIVLHLEADDKKVWLLNGRQAFDREFVIASFGRLRNEHLVPSSLYVLTGEIAVGDPFVDGPCLPGQIETTSQFELGSAHFTVKMCTFLGGGLTSGYKWHSLELTDSSTKLTEDEKKPLTIIGVEEIRSKVNYRWNHHNGCDSFHADLGFAQYAATSAALAGCGLAVPNAPIRTGSALSAQNVLYRTKYHDDPWVDGVVESRTHYLNFVGE